MAVYTNSQKIRLRLMTLWRKDNHGYDDFEDFYDAFTEELLDNVEFIAESFDL